MEAGVEEEKFERRPIEVEQQLNLDLNLDQVWNWRICKLLIIGSSGKTRAYNSSVSRIINIFFISNLRSASGNV